MKKRYRVMQSTLVSGDIYYRCIMIYRGIKIGEPIHTIVMYKLNVEQFKITLTDPKYL
jgi:hypothetical protein